MVTADENWGAINVTGHALASMARGGIVVGVCDACESEKKS